MNEHPQENIKYFWEDLPVGMTMDLGSVTVERDEALEFARKYDPQPFHLNDEAAAKSLFGRVSASGWHTCCLAMGLAVRNLMGETAGLGSPGLEKVKWPKPVYLGDTLTLQIHVTESRALKSRPGVGLTRIVWEMFNQDGEQVLMMDGYCMVGRRTTGVPSNDKRGAD